MNQASLLFQLQTIDLEISRHRNRLEEIYSQLIDDRILQQTFSRVHDSKLILSLARQELKSLEETANETRIKIETSESSLYSGKINSPKELKDLEAEIQFLKRRLSSIDDQQLVVMTNIEGLESDHILVIDHLNKIQSARETQNSILTAEQGKLRNNIERLDVERIATTSSIQPDNIKLYDNIRNQKKGVAVVLISDESCNACGSALRPAEIQSARSSAQLTQCTSCGRILYAG